MFSTAWKMALTYQSNVRSHHLSPMGERYEACLYIFTTVNNKFSVRIRFWNINTFVSIYHDRFFWPEIRMSLTLKTSYGTMILACTGIGSSGKGSWDSSHPGHRWTRTPWTGEERTVRSKMAAVEEPNGNSFICLPLKLGKLWSYCAIKWRKEASCSQRYETVLKDWAIFILRRLIFLSAPCHQVWQIFAFIP